jgi:DNA polymerase
VPVETGGLEQIAAEIHNCKSCRLHETRRNAVPGEGVQNPLVMVIGEGPGADEDSSGRPFVGRAGQLLDKMLAAIGLSRKTNCFIANVVKCRPPENRRPLPDETGPCAFFLERQIRFLKPGFILCAGRSSGQSILKTDEPIGAMRGKIIQYQFDDRTIPLIASCHPSALLRNEDLKRPAWEDLKLLRLAIEQAGTE